MNSANFRRKGKHKGDFFISNILWVNVQFKRFKKDKTGVKQRFIGML